jgi:hypothetical protein
MSSASFEMKVFAVTQLLNPSKALFEFLHVQLMCFHQLLVIFCVFCLILLFYTPFVPYDKHLSMLSTLMQGSFKRDTL